MQERKVSVRECECGGCFKVMGCVRVCEGVSVCGVYAGSVRRWVWGVRVGMKSVRYEARDGVTHLFVIIRKLTSS